MFHKSIEVQIVIELVPKIPHSQLSWEFFWRDVKWQIKSLAVESEILVLGLIIICVEFKITCDNQECVKCHHHGYWLKKKWTAGVRRTVGQIPKKCKETSNLMWLSMIWLISVKFVCWNLFCTIANLRIKCVTETKNASVLFYKNVKSSFSTWLTHLTLRFLYILGCSGPRCGTPRDDRPES